MSLAGFLPDPTNQGKDNQGRVEDEEKDVQEGIHQWGIAGRLRLKKVHPQQQVSEARVDQEVQINHQTVSCVARLSCSIIIESPHQFGETSCVRHSSPF